ncbi:MAG: hypothetical protein IT370_30085 [Deltaproteobacteria bacterium]|nr:hypothetical protein [Deltaproteobacteria bacterium]
MRLLSWLVVPALAVVAGCGAEPGRDSVGAAASADSTLYAVHVDCEAGPGMRGAGMGPGGKGRGGPGMTGGGPGMMHGGPGMKGGGPGMMGGGPGMKGGGPGMMGGGMGAPAGMAEIHTLLAAPGSFERRVSYTARGVETWTTTSDAALVPALRSHVRAMTARMKAGQPIHAFDPLFRKLAAHATEIELPTIEDIPGGLHVIETGATPEAVQLVQAHAQVVTWFAANGHAEAHRCHDVPPRP